MCSHVETKARMAIRAWLFDEFTLLLMCVTQVKPVTRKEVQNIWTHVMKRFHAASVQPAAVAAEVTARVVSSLQL